MCLTAEACQWCKNVTLLLQVHPYCFQRKQESKQEPGAANLMHLIISKRERLEKQKFWLFADL